MEAYANVLTIAIGFFTILMAIEYGFSRLMKKKVYRTFDTITSLSSGMTNNIKTILKLTIIIVSYEWMVGHIAVFEIGTSPWVYLLAFIGIDFGSYWSHRWNHEFNIMWNRHITHHSSEEYNLAAALRQPLSGMIEVYFFLYIPMALIGIPYQVVVILAPLHLFAQFWYHTKLINKMGFLEHLIMTPSHHRVHHAINKEYIDRNYGAIFICWDKWFGTFQEELPEVTPVYGVKKAVETWNPVLINFIHLWGLLKDAWRTQNWWDKIRIFFMPTGWRPADVNEKFPIEYVEHAPDQVKYTTKATRGLMVWSVIQLTLHLLFQFHLITLLPDRAYFDLFYYGMFLLVSIFAYTTLMDRHRLAVPVELLKLVMGFALMYHLNSWYHLDHYLPYGNGLFAIYLVVSMGITLYYTLVDHSEYEMAV